MDFLVFASSLELNNQTSHMNKEILKILLRLSPTSQNTTAVPLYLL